MQLYCPACKTSSPAAERCPRCGERLVAPSELASLSRDQLADPPDLVETTGFGRVAVGVVVALGLAVSFAELSRGLWAFAGLSDDPLGQTVAWVLRTVAILVGALLSGAGRTNGASAAGVAAVTCVGLLLATDYLAATKTTQTELGVAAFACVLALVAGIVGSTLWPAVPPLPPSKLHSRGSSLLPLKNDQDGPRPVEFLYARVAVAVALAVAGVCLADTARLGVRSVAGAGFAVGSPAQVPAVDFFFAATAVLAGGVLAGGGTGAGLRHGLAFGLTTAVLVAFAAVIGKESPMVPLTGLLELTGYATESPRGFTGAVVTVVSLTTLGVLGGGFGGVLLPRLAMKARGRARHD